MGCAQHHSIATLKGNTMKVDIEVTPDGYRKARLIGPYSAVLIVRPDGSHCYSNVKEDSEIYAVLNSSLFTPKGLTMPITRHATNRETIPGGSLCASTGQLSNIATIERKPDHERQQPHAPGTTSASPEAARVALPRATPCIPPRSTNRAHGTPT